MSARYAAMFDRCRAAGEGAFGAFATLGDPDPEASSHYLDAFVAGGADFVELGIAFSDPVADGLVIQQAGQRALAAGVRTAGALHIIAGFRRRHPDVAAGVLTYANILAAPGIDRFCGDLAEAGADSLLVADVPTLEAAPYAEAAHRHGIDLIMIAAPNTDRQRVKRIAALSSGFTYCVARAGVTGADLPPELDHTRLFADLADAGAPPPILGFGISTPEDARAAIAAGAAGAICGSAIVRRIAAGASASEVAEFVKAMKRACS